MKRFHPVCVLGKTGHAGHAISQALMRRGNKDQIARIWDFVVFFMQRKSREGAWKGSWTQQLTTCKHVNLSHGSMKTFSFQPPGTTFFHTGGLRTQLFLLSGVHLNSPRLLCIVASPCWMSYCACSHYFRCSLEFAKSNILSSSKLRDALKNSEAIWTNAWVYWDDPIFCWLKGWVKPLHQTIK